LSAYVSDEANNSNSTLNICTRGKHVTAHTKNKTKFAFAFH